ncbi:MAG: hypothetical protein IIX42_07535, partial [Alistipes sp.]|nr:hypothetical protein [Alistipes sp.]
QSALGCCRRSSLSQFGEYEVNDPAKQTVKQLRLKINFRHIAHQSRQSSIVTTSMQSALGCCRRSSLSQFGEYEVNEPAKQTVEQLCLKINFRHIAHQSRQSSIVTTSIRSALGCCRRSSTVQRRIDGSGSLKIWHIFFNQGRLGEDTAP